MSARNHAVDGQDIIQFPPNSKQHRQGRAASGKNRTVSTLGIGVLALVIRSFYGLVTSKGQHLEIS